MKRTDAFRKAGKCAAGLTLSAYTLLAGFTTQEQQIQFGDRIADARKSHVVLLTDAVEVAAGSPQEMELRFRVDPGFHINSHTPRDEFLLRTDLQLQSVPNVKVLSEQYPAGTAFRLALGDGETLDVYENEFRVRLRVVSQHGSATLSGALHYQACDASACFPPRTLPVRVLVTAK